VKPTEINELYQAALMQLPIANYRRHFVMAVLDCFSRYLLVLRVSPMATIPDLIKGLDQALEEARRESDLPKDRAITLVTDTGPRLDTPAFSDYVAGSPFRFGPSELRTFRSLGSIRRLLWTLKDEEISLNIYRNPDEAQRSLERSAASTTASDPIKHWAIMFQRTFSARSVSRFRHFDGPSNKGDLSRNDSMLFITRALLDVIEREPKLKLVGTGTPNLQPVSAPLEAVKQ